MNKMGLIALILLTLPILLLAACGGPKSSSPARTTSGSSAGPGSGSSGGGPALSPGETHFYTVVLPQFNSRCMSCHNEPRFGGNGPLTIYGYAAMKSLLNSSGGSSVNNSLINKMQGIITHTGGSVCLSGLAQSPCKEVVEWWQKENPTAASAAGYIGGIDSIDEIGTVYGWAQNVNNPAASLTVLLYDGAVGAGGVMIASVTANQVGPGGPGLNHYFSFNLPAAYANGTSRSLYAYAVSAAAANQLPSSPKTYTAYTPRAAGRTYYDGTLKPMLVNRCAGCHSMAELDYQAKYFDLISPTPAAGGTSTNNKLINKASGGMSHGGGNVCGNKNTAPCLQMQQWWITEFN